MNRASDVRRCIHVFMNRASDVRRYIHVFVNRASDVRRCIHVFVNKASDVKRCIHVFVNRASDVRRYIHVFMNRASDVRRCIHVFWNGCFSLKNNEKVNRERNSTFEKRKMKAYNIRKYGAPDKVLSIAEAKKPVPENAEVLIKVRAAAINDYDWCLTTGKPYAYRLFFGIFSPRKKLLVPGMEVAGIVEQVGNSVTKFKVGDAVYGDISDYGFGSFAEFLCIDEKALARKPNRMSFEEAASIPHATMLALQGLRDVGQLKEKQKVLINGGGGGVGSFGIQLAKLYKADVTGVDTGEKLKAMESQGFDKVIDFKQEDFTKSDIQYDLILDCRTSRSLWEFLKVLKPEGKYVSIGGKTGKLLQMLYMAPLLKLFSKKRLHMVTLKANKDLEFINRLYEEGKISCVIDGPYTFDRIPWAVQRFGDGLHTGKIVITVN
jgi:NADPH:quinone reductase-like Zn-dependent oxidoreductase